MNAYLNSDLKKKIYFYYMMSFKYLTKQHAITELLFLALKLCVFA